MGSMSVSRSNDYLLRNGKPFFYLADTVWMVFANLPIEKWEPYLKLRKMQGFNALQISILPVLHDTSLSEANIDPFLCDPQGNWDFSQYNEDYFRKAEKMVAMAVEYGFVPVLGVLWKTYVDRRSGAGSPLPAPMPLEVVKTYSEYVVRRFKKYDPVFFISGDTPFEGDHDETYYKESYRAVKRVCPDALYSMHIAGRRVLPDSYVEDVDFYMYQSGHSAAEQSSSYTLARRFYDMQVKRPIVNSEPCYEGHGKMGGDGLAKFSAFDVRKATWQSLLAGAKMGITYGGHGIWSSHRKGMSFVSLQRSKQKFMPYEWEFGLQLGGAWDVGFAKWVFESFNLFDIDPITIAPPDEPEIIVSANKDRTKVVLYSPYTTDFELAFDLTGYHCTCFDLESRRTITPTVRTGDKSTVELPEFNHDVLLLAMK